MLKQYTLACLFAVASIGIAQAQVPIPADDAGPAVTLRVAAGNQASGDYTNLGAPSDWVPTVLSDLTAEVAWGYTAAGDSLACDSVVTDLTGKIGIVRRGSCSFVQKATNVFNAGGVGFIVCNNNETSPEEVITLGAAAGSFVPIPGVMISFNDCQRFAAALGAGETVEATFDADVENYSQINSGAAYNFPIVPASQAGTELVRPDVRASYLNLNPTDSIFNGTLTLTKPDGTSEVIGTTLDTIQPFDIELIVFQNADYSLDAGPGSYVFTMESDLDGAAPYSFEVVVTEEEYFQTVPNDTSALYRGARTNDDFYANSANSRFFIGMAVPIEVTATAKSFSFDICNAADLLDATDMDYPFVEFDLIDPDADNDFIIDLPGGNLSTFEDFSGDENLIGFAEYEITGDETCDDGILNPITVDWNPSGVSVDSVVLQAGKVYLVRTSVSSETSGSPVMPAFAGIDGPNNLFYGYDVTDPTGTFGDTLSFQVNYLELDQVYSGFTNFTYFQRLTLGNGVNVGTSEVLPGEFSLFPNPASDVTTLTYQLDEPVGGLVELRSITGARLFSQFVGPQAAVRIEVPTAELPNGSYVLRLMTSKGTRSMPLQIAR